MTKTMMKLEEMSLIIDQLKALVKNEDEAMTVFRECQLDFDRVTTHVIDVIEGLSVVHSTLYNHKVVNIYLDNLIKCKDYFYSKGHEDWHGDNFIEATYQMFDLVMGNDDLDEIREIIETALGESFIDLFSTDYDNAIDLEQDIKGDLWNFIDEEDDELYELFLSKFADDLDGLKQMLDEYTVKLVNVHKYVYDYNHSQFNTVYGDNIAMIKCCYFENRHKADLLRNTDFMGAINFLDEAIEKKLLSRESILKLVDVLFEDEFEGLTDFDLGINADSINDIDNLIYKLKQLKNGKSITLIPSDSLQDEFNDFYREVDNFYNALQDLLADEQYVHLPLYEGIYQVSELFDKHVTL